MTEIKLGMVEARFADIIWGSEPLSSAEVVKLAEKELGWKATKNLEEMCAGYTAIINSNVVKITQANLEVAEILNTLIGKKEF